MILVSSVWPQLMSWQPMGNTFVAVFAIPAFGHGFLTCISSSLSESQASLYRLRVVLAFLVDASS